MRGTRVLIQRPQKRRAKRCQDQAPMFMESAQGVLKGIEGGERVVCVVPLGGQPFEQ